MIRFEDHYTQEDTAFRSIESLFRSIHHANVTIEEMTMAIEFAIGQYERQIEQLKESLSELTLIELAIQGQVNVRNTDGIRDTVKQLDEWVDQNNPL